MDPASLVGTPGGLMKKKAKPKKKGEYSVFKAAKTIKKRKKRRQDMLNKIK